MKREKLKSCLWAVLLAFLLGYGGVACMVTGLELPAKLLGLALGCAVGALIPAVCLSFRRGGLVLGGIAALFTLLMAFSYRFHDQFRALCYSAMDYYNRGYGISIPDWIEGRTAESHLLPLFFIAGLVMVAVVWTVLREKRAFLAVAAALLPLSTCLIVTDTVPNTAPLYILLLGLVLLMMTQSVRRRDTAQGNRLTAILVLPVMAALSLLFFLVPQEEYSAPIRMNSMNDMLNWFANQLPAVNQTSDGELVISIGGNAKDEVDLSQTGNREESNTPAMELITDYTGTVYLRGRDYDVYTGLGWEATEDRVEDYGLTEIWQGTAQQATIRILGRRGQYYLPSYPTEAQTLTGGLAENADYVTTYSYAFSPLRPDWQKLWALYDSGFADTASPNIDSEAYLALPEETRQRAMTVLAQLLPSGVSSDLEIVDAIESYVKNSAVYDADTDRMPGGETDFAMWFLEESDTGFCVHFATAATVLLRSAGIPARYVEGYMVNTQAGQTTIVREKTAHAWVEYYLPYVGWVIMDPTPGSVDAPGEITAPSESTTATEPSETAPTDTSPETTPPAATGATEGSSQPSQAEGSTTEPSQLIGLPGDPSDPSSGGSAVFTVPQWFMDLLAAILWIAIAVLLVIAQWVLRRRQKLNRMHRGKPNMQALARYQEATRLARLRKTEVPVSLRELAEKAKFSQYQLAKEELDQFDAFLLESTRSLQKRPWYFRLICRFIFAAY